MRERQGDDCVQEVVLCRVLSSTLIPHGIWPFPLKPQQYQYRVAVEMIVYLMLYPARSGYGWHVLGQRESVRCTGARWKLGFTLLPTRLSDDDD